MKTFKELFADLQPEYFALDEHSELLEKLITFGGQAYPKFGNVVIMAGGAGSGKGFTLKNLIGIEGKVFDVDALKDLAARTPTIRRKVKAELGVDLEALADNLTTPENVSKLHEIIGDYLNLPDKKTMNMYTSILASDSQRKPNLIFDVTLKDLHKLEKISRQVSNIGYAKENIHIVWVINDIEIAKKQNLNPKRGRVVPAEILINTHRGASQTMGDILNMGKSLGKYMDGDIVFAFNKIGVDSSLAKSEKGGQYITDANYFYVKKRGGDVTPINKLEKDIRHKIAQYVPKGVEWE